MIDLIDSIGEKICWYYYIRIYGKRVLLKIILIALERRLMQLLQSYNPDAKSFESNLADNSVLCSFSGRRDPLR